jgi:hypothetical protein
MPTAKINQALYDLHFPAERRKPCFWKAVEQALSLYKMGLVESAHQIIRTAEVRAEYRAGRKAMGDEFGWKYDDEGEITHWHDGEPARFDVNGKLMPHSSET